MTATVSGRRFQNKRVVLADRRYENCTFIHCELVFDGRPVHLVDNAFAECSWSFDGAAGVTLSFLAALCQSDPDLRGSVARQLGLGGPSLETLDHRRPDVPQDRVIH
jgi:hypothetical protein